MKFSLAFVMTVIAAPCLAEPVAGYMRIENTSQQERPLTLSIWYPSDREASAEIGGNAVFTGTPAAAGAPVPTAPLPLIVLSHGGLRSARDSGAWLASSLSQDGAVVVEVSADRPTDAAAALDEIWERPRDLSRAVDMLFGDPRWTGAIDESEVSIVGYALGGTAAISATGQVLDVDRYAGSCDDGGAGGPDCAWFASQGISPNDIRARSHDEPLHDARFTSSVVIAPEYLSAFDQNAATAGTRMLFITLGQAGVLSDHAALGSNVAIPDSTPFDAFPVCTKAGADILLEEEGDAAICETSEDRGNAHKNIAAAITSFLRNGELQPVVP